MRLKALEHVSCSHSMSSNLRVPCSRSCSFSKLTVYAATVESGGCAACAPPWQSRYSTTCRYSPRVDRLDSALVAPGGGPQPQPNRDARRGHPHPLTNQPRGINDYDE